MLASQVNRNDFDVSTPSDEEIRMTRTFDAPRELVFEAMTRPEHVRRWWGNLGEGYSVPVCEIDLRVGGDWHFVNRHPRGEVIFYGEYREITRPSRLVFTEIFADFPATVSLVTCVLEAVGERTHCVVTVRYPTREVRDIVMSTGMARGAALSYDRLNDLVIELVGRVHQKEGKFDASTW